MFEIGVKLLKQPSAKGSSPKMAEKVQIKSEHHSPRTAQAVNLSDESSESNCENENNDNWACPWKAQHKNIQISVFHSPNDFYITQKSPQ